MGGWLGWLSAPEYWLSRLMLERALGLLYLVAFVVALNQFRPGERGLLPVTRFTTAVPFSRTPSLFHYSDRLLSTVCWVGIVLFRFPAGRRVPQRGPWWAPMVCWLTLWVLYLSIVNVGQVFYDVARGDGRSLEPPVDSRAGQAAAG